MQNGFLNVLVIFTVCSVFKTHTAHLFEGILQCMTHSSSPTGNNSTGWIIHSDYMLISPTNIMSGIFPLIKQVGFHLLFSVLNINRVENKKSNLNPTFYNSNVTFSSYL